MIYTGYANYSDDELIDLTYRNIAEGPEPTSLPYIELILRMTDAAVEAEQDLKDLSNTLEDLQREVDKLNDELEELKGIK